MIEIKELRLGNSVSVPACAAHATITALTANSVIVDSDEIYLPPDERHFSDYDLLPIQVSNHVLRQFGFVVTEQRIGYGQLADYFSVDGLMIKFDRQQQKYLAFNFNDEDSFYSMEGIELAFVHQLQNYYFAHTGKELIYKP